MEFALVVPLLVSLLFGIIWFGFIYADHISLTNAVREGARYGAAADASTPATWAASVSARVSQTYFDAESDASTAKICVELDNSAGAVASSIPAGGCGTAPTAPAFTSLASGACVVKVWAIKNRTIHLGVLPDLHPTLGAESVTYYGRQVGSCTAQP